MKAPQFGPPALQVAQRKDETGNGRTRLRGKGLEKPVPTEDGPEVVGKNGKIERRMFKWDAVFPKECLEFCFEEVRLQNYGAFGDRVTLAEDRVKAWETMWHTPRCKLRNSGV